VADGVLLNAYTPTTYIAYAVDEVRKAARASGRNPGEIDIACMLVMRPTEDPAAMLDSLKSRVVRLLDEPHVGEILLEKGGYDPEILPTLRESVRQDGGRSAASLISDEMVDSFYVVGSPERCRERIDEYRQAGVNLPLLLPRLEDFDQVAQGMAVT
jgi:5,10-methylenetetrahydromethanopterin reductase